jgi:hypothetical protein
MARADAGAVDRGAIGGVGHRLVQLSERVGYIININPRAKFEAGKMLISWRQLENSSPKKIFTILNLASCFQATAARTIE